MKRAAAIVLTALLVVVSLGAPAFAAPETHFGRERWRGYFTNKLDKRGEKVFSEGIQLGNDRTATSAQRADILIKTLRDKYNGSNTHSKTGAAFIVKTMLGKSAQTSGGRSVSEAEFTELRKRLDGLLADGGTITHERVSYRVNTYWQGSATNDVAWYKERGSQTAYVFRHKGKIVYVLKQNCANPLGDRSLPEFPPTIIPNPDSRPQVTAAATCDGTVRGFAQDLDDPTHKVWLEIWHGPRERPGSVRLNLSGTVADKGSGHDYSFTRPNFFSTRKTIYVYARGVTSGGRDTAPTSAAAWGEARVTQGPCTDYTITPSIKRKGSSSSTVTIGDTVEFEGSLRNDGPTPSRMSDGGGVWYAVKSFIIEPDGSGYNKSPWGSDAYVDTASRGYVTQPSNIPTVDCEAVNRMRLYSPVNPGCLSTQGFTSERGLSRATVNGGATYPIPPVQSVNTSGMRAGTQICKFISVDYANATGARHRWSKPVCVTVAKSPSVAITGGDVAVGRGGASGAEINVLHHGNGTQCYGSSLEFAAIAPGMIHAKTGAELYNTCRSGRLAFANTSRLGLFGATGARRVLQSNLPNAQKRTVTTIDLSSLSPGRHVLRGDTVRVSGVVNAGVSVEIVATDTIKVTGDVVYADGPYTDFSLLPQVIMRAQKSIEISDAVTRVDGWFSTQGTVSTCNTWRGLARYYSGLSTKTCEKQLRINGPVSAQRLFLRRTYGGEGSRLDERRQSAEKINFRSDAYLWAYGQQARGGKLRTQYIQELPPRF